MRSHGGRRSAGTSVAGQALFTSAGTTQWTVPDGVTALAMVCIQANGSAAATSVTVGTTVVCRAQNGARIGDGGGDGGPGGPPTYDGGSYMPGGGGGGAGGYNGNGGAGGAGVPPTMNWSIGIGGDGQGGGGGGGAGAFQQYNVFPPPGGGTGGGVSPYGAGANGKGATPVYGKGVDGGPGSGAVGRLYGGGPGAGQFGAGAAGGALAWRNAVPVVPGSTVTINCAADGCARLIWGEGRAYPSTNTGDV